MEPVEGLAELVVFRLEGREYAFPLEHVNEVLGMVALTPVPEAPPWLSGVINLRGQVVPVVDLRTRLGLPYQVPGLSTPIMVVQAGGRMAGLIVDAVDEVLALPPGSIGPSDDLVEPVRCVVAVATAGDRVVLVLEPRHLIAGSVRLVPVER
jgi:purine-binding chemotaxis protein CheW